MPELVVTANNCTHIFYGDMVVSPWNCIMVALPQLSPSIWFLIGNLAGVPGKGRDAGALDQIYDRKELYAFYNVALLLSILKQFCNNNHLFIFKLWYMSGFPLLYSILSYLKYCCFILLWTLLYMERMHSSFYTLSVPLLSNHTWYFSRTMLFWSFFLIMASYFF